jgi:hypothetical protein
MSRCLIDICLFRGKPTDTKTGGFRFPLCSHINKYSSHVCDVQWVTCMLQEELRDILSIAKDRLDDPTDDPQTDVGCSLDTTPDSKKRVVKKPDGKTP